MTNSLLNLMKYSATDPDTWYSNRTQRSLKVDKQFKEYVYHPGKTPPIVGAAAAASSATNTGDSSPHTLLASDFPMRKNYCWNFSPNHESCFRRSTQSFKRFIVAPPLPSTATLSRKRFSIVRDKAASGSAVSSKIVCTIAHDSVEQTIEQAKKKYSVSRV
jgi:hypothetical protein